MQQESNYCDEKISAQILTEFQLLYRSYNKKFTEIKK